MTVAHHTEIKLRITSLQSCNYTKPKLTALLRLSPLTASTAGDCPPLLLWKHFRIRLHTVAGRSPDFHLEPRPRSQVTAALFPCCQRNEVGNAWERGFNFMILTVGHCAMKLERSLARNEQPVLAAITYSSLQNSLVPGQGRGYLQNNKTWLGTRVGG